MRVLMVEILLLVLQVSDDVVCSVAFYGCDVSK